MNDSAENPMPGLYLRGGTWHMSYVHNGQRVRRRTGYRDYVAAKAYFLREKAAREDRALTTAWAEIVTAGMGGGQWLRGLFNASARRARDANREHTLTMDQLKDIAIFSGGRCMLTGITFELPDLKRPQRLAFAPSLDRIDSRHGYTKTNSRLVCASVNYAMNTWGDRVLERIALAYLARKLAEPIDSGHIPVTVADAAAQHDSQLLDLVDGTGIEPVAPAV